MQPRSTAEGREVKGLGGALRLLPAETRFQLQTGHENTEAQNNCTRKLQAAFLWQYLLCLRAFMAGVSLSPGNHKLENANISKHS